TGTGSRRVSSACVRSRATRARIPESRSPAYLRFEGTGGARGRWTKGTRAVAVDFHEHFGRRFGERPMIPAFRSCRLAILTAACALPLCSAHAQTENPQRTQIPSGPYRIAGTV